MKKFCLILVVLILMFSFCACRRVEVSNADSLVMRNWTTLTNSKMEAELIFEEDTAQFTLFDSQHNVLGIIEGVYAVDSKNLYITDPVLCKTYSFGYKVFSNRAELEYMGKNLIFTPFEADLSQGKKSAQ